MKTFTLTCTFLLLFISISFAQKVSSPKSFSGIYPQLAYYNNEGECGTGAVVPWADRLWVITYGPHMPFGSSDKLYEITPELKKIIRPESIGGTPANRLIHKESNQLFIGPYAIDSNRNVRVISWKDMPGRLTGSARHLTNPAGKIYTATMEEGFYEIDVKTLKPTLIYADGNVKKNGHDDTDALPVNDLLPGAHGKGLYSGQGVLVFVNNGGNNKAALSDFKAQSGVLAEWNGKDWKVIRENQFVEVTGPDGINGASKPDSEPIWSIGFDFKSLLVAVRDNGKWSFFRLPKASHSYDGAHGWNNEWPRIRNVGTAENPDYLMTMHGMFWRFPGTFCSTNSAGIRPRSAYLKVIGDFTRWNNQLVFGCDDSAQKEFLNGRKVKGEIGGPGQSQSNLWFTSLTQPDNLGPTNAEGAVWISENIKANEHSEPFLFTGWEYRSSWLKNEGNETVTFSFDVDINGNGVWKQLKTIKLTPNEAVNVVFAYYEKGEWIRVSTDKATKATVQFSYAQKEKRSTASDMIFNGLSPLSGKTSTAGLLWSLGDNRRKLGVLSGIATNKEFNETGYYELDSAMNLVKKTDENTAEILRAKFAIHKQLVSIDDASVLIIDDSGRRWRLPKGDKKANELTLNGLSRVCREVSTERDVFSCAGTFYELPAENADGFAKIRPVSSHKFRIFDFNSFRGMLILTGIDVPTLKNASNDHIITSADGKAAVWAGVIDDLWKFGKPVGQGGPWKNTKVAAGVASDPYLIGFYDKRRLELSHTGKQAVQFSIEVEPIGHGPWMVYKKVTVKPGERFKMTFPTEFQSRWIRFVADTNCTATAWLEYK